LDAHWGGTLLPDETIGRLNEKHIFSRGCGAPLGEPMSDSDLYPKRCSICKTWLYNKGQDHQHMYLCHGEPLNGIRSNWD
jgi:hypothetical protein